MRKTKLVTVREQGRDKGKTYLITEMSAANAEKWAYRAFLALAHGGVDPPPGLSEMGMAGLAIVGLKALGQASWHEAEPLLDEMIDCAQFVGDLNVSNPVSGQPMSRPLVEDDIEEVRTRILLRTEVFDLHTGFSITDEWSKLTSASVTKSLDSKNTITSHVQSEQ